MPQTLDSLIDDYLADRFEEHPHVASGLGVDGYYEKTGDFSGEAFARRDEKVDHWLRRFGALDPGGLDFAEQIDRELILSTLRGARIMRDWEAWKKDPAVYLDPGQSGVFGLFLHRILPEAELAAAAAARLEAVPRTLEEGKENLDPELANPLSCDRALRQCRAGAHYFRNLVPAEVEDAAARERLTASGETAARACEDFADFIEKLGSSAGGDWAIGEERYSALLLEKEMLGYGARDMLERGRAVYDELSSEMAKFSKDFRGTDDWRAVLEDLKEDHPTSHDHLRGEYERWTGEARQFLIDHDLVTLPDGERCLVEPSPPFQRPVLAVPSYNSPPPFKPSLTGHFFVPYPPEGTPQEEVERRLRASLHGIPTTSVHEAYPGHHWHLVVIASTPRPIRKVHRTSYFVEGWALYAERMMRDQGFFADPRQELCHLAARIFRAARIIIDVSLHIGEMTFDEAAEFLTTRLTSNEPTARTEVGRYCSWPTQAPSYLTGSLEIERMRERYFSEKRGDLKAFHDTIASSGGLPIAIAERSLFGP